VLPWPGQEGHVPWLEIESPAGIPGSATDEYELGKKMTRSENDRNLFDSTTLFYRAALSASIASRAKEKGLLRYPIVYTDRSINGSAFFLEAFSRALRVQDTLLDSRRTRRCILSPLNSWQTECIASEIYHHRFSSQTDVVHSGRIGTSL